MPVELNKCHFCLAFLSGVNFPIFFNFLHPALNISHLLPWLQNDGLPKNTDILSDSLVKELMKSAISGFGQLPAEQRADVAWKRFSRFFLLADVVDVFSEKIAGVSVFRLKEKNALQKVEEYKQPHFPQKGLLVESSQND